MIAADTASWITAVGTAFAAIGTVGAVIVALWQTRRRDGYKVHVSCRTGVTGDPEIGDLVTLQATNTGERLVKLTMAYLLTDDNRSVVATFFQPPLHGVNLITSMERSPLPESLVDGESVSIQWQRSTLDAIKGKDGFAHYLCAYFTDPLGNMYADAFPGVKVKRKGWLWRKREYAPPTV